MTIQFQCVSCGKPIEIDDAWALKLVQCPYCDDTVTAPGISTYRPPQAAEQTPTHAEVPIGVGGLGSDVGADVRTAPADSQRGGKIAIVALVLACVSLLVLGWSVSGLMAVIEANFDIEQLAGPGSTLDDQIRVQREIAEFFQEAMERGDLSVMRSAMGLVLGMVLWLAGLVCSIVALCWPGRRRLAVAAAVISAVPLLILCFGVVLS